MLCGNIIRARCIVVTYVILQNFQYCIYSICITDIVWFVPINFEPVIMIDARYHYRASIIITGSKLKCDVEI